MFWNLQEDKKKIEGQKNKFCRFKTEGIMEKKIGYWTNI